MKIDITLPQITDALDYMTSEELEELQNRLNSAILIKKIRRSKLVEFLNNLDLEGPKETKKD